MGNIVALRVGDYLDAGTLHCIAAVKAKVGPDRLLPELLREGIGMSRRVDTR